MGMELELKIVSPEKVEYDGLVASVTVPGMLGPFQILPGHAAIISSLENGTVEYVCKDGRRALQIAGGFVEVQRNKVAVCVELPVGDKK